jgi:Ca2+-transporting ATPase
LLLACGAIYMMLRDAQHARMLPGFVVVVPGITLFEEQKTATIAER